MQRHEASLASDGIPMAESFVEETGHINVAEGIDKLENARVSVVIGEGKDVIMESSENYSKPLEEFELKNGSKDVDWKEDKMSKNSWNVIDDWINEEVSQHLGGKRDENELEDSLDIKEALKMPQNEHKNEPDEFDSTSMQDYLVPENSSKEFCEDDHQSEKIDERTEREDVQVIESMAGKETDRVEDNGMELPIQAYGFEPSALAKDLKPEEIADPKALESETEASLASDGMAESSVEETGDINVAQEIDDLENTRVSVVSDEGKDIIMESGVNSWTVIDGSINFEDFPSGETTDIHFENGEVSRYLGGKRDENELEDSLDIEEALKMPQDERKNEPDVSDSTSMQDLVSENSPKEFVSEEICEDDQLHQSDKIEERGVIESMEGKKTDQVKDYEPEPSAVVKNLKPEEVADPKLLESTGIQNAEGVLEIYVPERASIWDCCCFLNWLRAHED
ncbi:hypothetical protein SUGI_0222640 [Cryptomeria japonica]|uniref:uncharacterized protein LOC131029199 isoform X2 n=1 Tax=Cryptomeria japonica TaxID=3369 RepID=UPI002408EEBB|nr:uncharacterized protein LOC131029199 isoform X2 [Cryptomeria japonica]GLJ13933.1 hypothetical protein SUGI_0222640 [Cryptomeria japonica]